MQLGIRVRFIRPVKAILLWGDLEINPTGWGHPRFTIHVTEEKREDAFSVRPNKSGRTAAKLEMRFKMRLYV